jgi:hypothetical protein
LERVAFLASFASYCICYLRCNDHATALFHKGLN